MRFWPRRYMWAAARCGAPRHSAGARPGHSVPAAGVPAYGGSVQGELCTPTGAALLRHFKKHFGPMPVMAARAIGCGMGKRNLRRPTVRGLLGGDGGPAG